MKTRKGITPPVMQWRSGVVIDTGPLLIALTSFIEFDTGMTVDMSHRLLDHVTRNDPSIRDDREFRRSFLNWLKAQHAIRTTAHVLTEVHGHIRRSRIKGAYHASVWDGCIGFWGEFGIEEDLLRLQDRWNDPDYRTMIGEIGSTDTAVLALTAECRLPLLTNDRMLLRSGAKVEAKILMLTDLR